ncbi:hypothetical protein NYR58_12540 [Chelativorans intermedius]|nr:hypothetical protein [Chelativorans intermedius]
MNWRNTSSALAGRARYRGRKIGATDMELDQKALALLPGPSRAKLERLAAERDAAHAAFRAASDHEQEARGDLARLEAQMRDRLALPAGVELDQHPAAAVVAARSGRAERERAEAEARLIEPVEAARRRHQATLDARERAAQRWHQFAFLDGCAGWLQRAATLGVGRLKHHAPPAPKTRDAVAEIAKLRAELQALEAQWAEAEAAPVPAQILRQQAIAEIDAMAAAGALTISAGDRSGTPLGLARKLQLGLVPTPAGPDGAPRFSIIGDGGAALFTWTMRDALVERLDALIAALPQDGALSDDERDERFRQIAAKRLDLERAEEALICAAEAEGRIVQRRRDADPRAVLEVAEV